MKPLYVSHSPVTNTFKGDLGGKRQIILGRWRKSVKDSKSIGGKIFANVFGDSKKEAEANAKIVAALPDLINVLEFIAASENFQDHSLCRNKAAKILESITPA